MPTVIAIYCFIYLINMAEEAVLMHECVVNNNSVRRHIKMPPKQTSCPLLHPKTNLKSFGSCNGNDARPRPLLIRSHTLQKLIKKLFNLRCTPTFLIYRLSYELYIMTRTQIGVWCRKTIEKVLSFALTLQIKRIIYLSCLFVTI